MCINFQTDDLVGKLTLVASIVSSKNPIAILDNVLVRTFDDSVVLTCSDSDTWVSVKAPITYKDEDFSFCVNAKDFLSTIKNLAGMEVSLKLNANSKTIQGVYNNGKFTMPYGDASEFPTQNIKMDDAITQPVNADVLFGFINKSGVATANTELRPVMNGIYFDVYKDHTVGVSSDGCKLVKFTDLRIKGNHNEEKVGFIMPKKPAGVITSILSSIHDDVTLSFNEKCISVSHESFKVTTRAIEGRYPNYESVIPKSNNISVVVEKSDLTGALKRIIPMGNIASCLVKLVFENGKLTLNAEDFDFSKSATESVPCDYNGEPFVIGFKGTTLLEMIQNIDGDKVRILLTDEQRAGVLEPFSNTPSTIYLSLIMPLVID